MENYAEIHQDTFRSISTEQVNKILDCLDELSGFAVYRNDLIERDIDETFNTIIDYTNKIYDMYKAKRERFRLTTDKNKSSFVSTVKTKPIVANHTSESEPEQSKSKDKPGCVKDGRANNGGVRHTCAVRYYEDGAYVCTYRSLREASQDTGVPLTTLRNKLDAGNGVVTMYDNFRFERVEGGD